MSRGKCDIRVGTSGWHYDHWRLRFYPKDLSKPGWLSFYADHFDSVEVNNTFYQLPKETSVENWYAQVPADFVFTLKANRFITHIKRLKDAGEALARFQNVATLLKDKLGCVLYQLPPNLKIDLSRLEDFLKLLPADQISVFEFRNVSWYCDEVFELLDSYHCGFCVHDLGGLKTPMVVTGGIVYVRFHGPEEKYAGCYTNPALKKWAKWISENLPSARAGFAYFNNDVQGHAVRNADQLKKLLAGSFKTASR